MGLLDKAKEIKEDEEAPVSEPEEEEVTKPKTKKKASSPAAKKGKKKASKPGLKKKSAGKKPAAKKKAPMKKKAKKPKKEKVVEEPAEPTIEGLPEDLEFAQLKYRALAAVIDWVLLTVICIVAFVALFLSIEEAGMGVAAIITILLPFLYFMFMEGTTGQTFGKRTAHVKVISLDGRPLNPKRYMKAALWKGISLPMIIPVPIMSIIDVIIGIFFSHKDTQQRISQYNGDLIVVAVPKKKVKFGYTEDEDDEGDDIPMEDEAGEGAVDDESSVTDSEDEETQDTE